MSKTFYQETQIPDGPLVLSHHMPEAQSVALGVFVDAGSRDETESQAGITHALEHMLFKGTRRLDVHQLAEKLDELGGNANAFTSRERTCFHLHVLHEHWPEALELLTSMVREPALPEAEWQREREVIFAEMAMVEDTPEEWVMDQHVHALFGDHAIGRPVLGTHESLLSISGEELRGYLNQRYQPPGLMLVAAGRIDHEALIEKLSGWAWHVQQTGHGREAPASLEQGVQSLPREGEQAQLVLSFPGIHAASDERPVAWLANQMLGGGLSSRLFREVREKRGLAYSVGSHLSMLSDTGSWTISCSTEPAHGAECVSVLADVFRRFGDTVEKAELERAKRQLEVQFRMGLESVEGQMLYLGARLDEAQVKSPLEWLAEIRAVELEAVKRWITARVSAGELWSIAAPEQALQKISDTIRASCSNH